MKALITGVTGQDGAYLAKLLLEKGYEVHGATRPPVSRSHWRLDELGIAANIRLHPANLLDLADVTSLIRETEPDEIYNLAAQSSVAASYREPILTAELDGLGPLRLLEAMRDAGVPARFFQASSSEMFGRASETPQTEDTPSRPISPYGVAKLFGHGMVTAYREAHGLFCASGILFNHESPLRGQAFVTRKITLTLARMAQGSGEVLELGDLSASRDWGFAGDYVAGMWLMLQADTPEDYILASGEANTVEAFADLAARLLGFEPVWEGEGVSRRARDRRSNRPLITVNADFFRPSGAQAVTGSPRKAQAKLGWRQTVPFQELVAMMCRADYDRVKNNHLFG